MIYCYYSVFCRNFKYSYNNLSKCELISTTCSISSTVLYLTCEGLSYSKGYTITEGSVDLMPYNDTKYSTIEETLKAVGKTVFVEFYYDFKDTSISTDVLAQKLYQNNPRAKSTNQNFRIARARHIFKTGQNLVVLKNIIDSDRVESTVRQKAKNILERENLPHRLLLLKSSTNNNLSLLSTTKSLISIVPILHTTIPQSRQSAKQML